MFSTKEITSKIINKVVVEACDTICSTMSPNGQYVNISKSGLPSLTKDGTTVANALQYRDPASDMIVRQIAQATTRTDELCGDGTTTTAFIIKTFYEVFKDNMTFKRRKLIEKFTNIAVARVHEIATSVNLNDELLYDALLTTANHENDIVEMVIGAAKQFETFPRFILRDGNDSVDHLAIAQDIVYRGNFAEPSFSANGQGTVMHFKQYIPVVYEGSLDLNFTDQVEATAFTNFIIDGVAGLPVNDRNVLIYARDFNKGTLALFQQLNAQKQFTIVPIKIAGMGSSGAALMKDISTLLNVKLRQMPYDEDGIYSGLTVPMQASVAVGAVGFKPTTDTHRERVDLAKSSVLEHYRSLSLDVQRSALGQIIYNRYEILSTGTATIFVGGLVESDISERKARYEDVHKVAKSMLRNGVIKGCGATLVEIAEWLSASSGNKQDGFDDEYIAVRNSFTTALTQQTRFLLGYSQSTPAADFSYINLATGETYGSVDDMKVYDAAMATATALSTGVKTALLLINTSSIVTGQRSGGLTI